jgi:hypothetical protein
MRKHDMTKTFLTFVAIGMIGAAAASAQTFPAAAATGCDASAFTPVMGKAGNVLYWNNPTCAGFEDGQPLNIKGAEVALGIDIDGDGAIG